MLAALAKMVNHVCVICNAHSYKTWKPSKLCPVFEPIQKDIQFLLTRARVECFNCVMVLPRHYDSGVFRSVQKEHLLSFDTGNNIEGQLVPRDIEVWYIKGAVVSKRTNKAKQNDVQGLLPCLPLKSREDKHEVNEKSKPAGLTSKGSGAFHCTVVMAGQPIRALLDTGACTSFIAPNLVDKLQKAVVSKVLKVRSAGGGVIEALGMVPMLEFEIAGMLSKNDFWVMTLPQNTDIILGCDWLHTHGAVIRMAERKVSFTPRPPVDEIIPLEAKERQDGSVATEHPDGLTVIESQSKSLTVMLEQFKRAADRNRLISGKPEREKSLPYVGILDLFGRDTEEPIDLGEHGPGKVPHDQLAALLAEFSDVFPADIPAGVPARRERFGDIRIIPMAEGVVPVKQKAYRMSPLERTELTRQIEYMHQMGWIRRSTSPWGSPVTFAAKADGKLRLCVDLRKVNNLSIKNRVPLPRIDDLIDQVQGAKLFSALDLAAGYHQIPLSPEECERTAFFGISELWEYTVMPFGLSNAPAVFTSAMTRMLDKFMNKFVLVYLDDILIYSKTPEEHIKHLRLVLDEFRSAKLYARAHKCRFNRTSLPYLGHILTIDGVLPDPRKVQIVVDWPLPLTNVKDVERFLGLTNYFRKYIKGYGSVTAPLSDLRKKATVFEWTPACEKAAQYLKSALTQEPILAMPDFTDDAKRFEVICDASGQGIGAALFQGDKVIAYEGRKYRPAEENYSVGEQELLAVVHALHVWRCYLEGAPKFVVVTDHNPLIWFNSQDVLSRRQARWSEFMGRFNFEWNYRPGRLNVADPLSRASSLKETTTELLHDGEALTMILGLPPAECGAHVGMAHSPNGILNSFVSTFVEVPLRSHSANGQQILGKEFNAAVAFALVSILASVRGRPRLGREGDSADALALTRTGKRYNSELEDTQLSTRHDEGPRRTSDSGNGTGPISSKDTLIEEHQHQDDELAVPESDDDEMSIDDLEQATPDSSPNTVQKQLNDEGSMQTLLTEFLDLVKTGYVHDEWFQVGANVKPLVRDVQGLYWNNHQLVIPNYANLRTTCLRLCHDAPWAGHFGKHRTKAVVKQLYWWPKLETEIEQYVRTCQPCQRNKSSNQKPYGLMVPVQIPERRWSSISVDFIVQLPPTTSGYDAITAFVDRLSKYVVLTRSKTTDKGMDFAQDFVREIFARHGMPHEIISDRDTKFTATFWEHVTAMLGIQRCMSTSFHPRTDGQTERANRVI
jgi:RNase H-like domain found in reverse transcriptase/Reverse transcriptase (RNA-dependent DNA polymerase)/Integrase zinc binding domain/Retroviral aspartyl protease